MVDHGDSLSAECRSMAPPNPRGGVEWGLPGVLDTDVGNAVDLRDPGEALAVDAVLDHRQLAGVADQLVSIASTAAVRTAEQDGGVVLPRKAIDAEEPRSDIVL